MLRVLSHYAASCSGSGAGGVGGAAQCASIQAQLLLPALCSTVLGSTSGSCHPDEFTQWQGKRWATKKQGGSTKNKRGSLPKYLGVKMSDGQLAFPGQMLVKQRGTSFHPGHNVGVGVDFTLFAKTVGIVTFRRENVVLPGRPRSSYKHRKFVDVRPLNDDWSAEYQDKVAAMVAARNAIRTDMLGYAARHGKK